MALEEQLTFIQEKGYGKNLSRACMEQVKILLQSFVALEGQLAYIAEEEYDQLFPRAHWMRFYVYVAPQVMSPRVKSHVHGCEDKTLRDEDNAACGCLD